MYSAWRCSNSTSVLSGLKPCPHLQQCTIDVTLSNATSWTERFFRQSRMLLQQSRTLLRQCCSVCLDFFERTKISRKNAFDVVANGNNIEATIAFVEGIVRLVAFDNVASTLSLRQCCFDTAAGVDGALNNGVGRRWGGMRVPRIAYLSGQGET